MKILLVEDDKKIASFIEMGLDQAGHHVVPVSDGEAGYRMAQEHVFDVGIFDVMLPGVSGTAIIQRLREVGNQLPILILSAKNEVKDRVSGLTVGGDDYLTKPFAFTELLARLEALARRAKNISRPKELGIADLTLNVDTRRVFRGNKEINLQPREFDLLKFFLENIGRVVSKAMIIDNVWRYNFDPQTTVVETRVCKLREKVDQPGTVKLIHTIRGAGYVLRQIS